MFYEIIAAALFPVAILIFYIYYKDIKKPEPVKELLKAFFFGMLSIIVTFFLLLPVELIGIYPEEIINVWDSFCASFFGAAIPEELAKLFMLWLILRNNRYFDEKIDGIVYAVCVSLGFAAVENILYLFSNAEDYMSVAKLRGIFSVPGHFCDGVLMGYYYSLAKFYHKHATKNKILIIVAPVIAHGLYDFILFTSGVTIETAPLISIALTILFLIFCNEMWKYCSRRINELLERDNEPTVIEVEEQEQITE